MKREYVGVIGLCVVLMLNIILTQLIVHQYFYENYSAVLIYTCFNIVLFPIGVFIYKHEVQRGRRIHD
ncbi:hypothetical protein [Sediminibacillus massiliensis]|uniref:hypothetical protein n=1 Tax=Sediminibacillus massiliensis TaxID=1926277 RepID=UPI0009885265|nr:hypothetical protein [Sediminibacillus massiliensis]